jgi:hypothetical protein
MVSIFFVLLFHLFFHQIVSRFFYFIFTLVDNENSEYRLNHRGSLSRYRRYYTL